MNEFFEIVVDSHLEDLKQIRKILRAVDKYPLDIVDCSRVGDAQFRLNLVIESFERMAEAARQSGVPA